MPYDIAERIIEHILNSFLYMTTWTPIRHYILLTRVLIKHSLGLIDKQGNWLFAFELDE